MNGFITKPVEAGALYETLGDFFSGADGRRAHRAGGAAAAAGAAGGRLLDVNRLESYRRMGMLEELLDDYMPEIARLVERLEHGVADQDLSAALDALHSLLGMSGEAGAPALYQLVRPIYVPMVEERSWPAQPGWLEQISCDHQRRPKQALKAYAPRCRLHA